MAASIVLTDGDGTIISNDKVHVSKGAEDPRNEVLALSKIIGDALESADYMICDDCGEWDYYKDMIEAPNAHVLCASCNSKKGINHE